MDKQSKLSKLDIYLSYNDGGALKKRVKDYALARHITLSKLILDALRNTYPDLKI